MGALEIDPVALSRAQRDLLAEGRELRSATPAVERVAADVLDGAGELQGELAVALAAFRLSWTSVLEVLADSTEAVGDAVDRARAHYLAREAAIARSLDGTP